MRAASAVLLVGIFALSAPTPHTTFRYEVLTFFRRETQDTCRVCYGDDCASLDKSRCEYYVEVDEILAKPEDDGEVTQVDEMVYELTDQAVNSWSVQKCIPLVSYYSDCNKENICVGCKVCNCTLAGTWRCSEVQKCLPEVELEVDHHTLAMVVEKLMENEAINRRKRSSDNITDKENNDLTEKPEVKMNQLDIAEWMYGVRPNLTADATLGDNNENDTQRLDDAEYVNHFASTSSKPAESEYLNFEEVLKSIATEDQTYKRRKPQLKDNETFDYMDLDEIKIVKNNDSDQFINILNAIEQGNDDVGKSVTESINDATFVVDLYPHGNNVYNNNKTDYSERSKTYIEDNNMISSLNDRFELDAVNIMKREISSVNDETNTTIVAETSTLAYSPITPKTTMDMNSDLKYNVLMPLTNIIEDKQNELKELAIIKENLVRYINMYNSTNLNVTEEPGATNISSTYFSIYKLDIISDIREHLRRNPNVLDEKLYKLKRDIYQVLKDIARIKKISKKLDLPDDLITLINSMTHYMYTQGSFRNFKRNDIKLEPIKYVNSRRLWMHPLDRKTESAVKNYIIDILEVLGKGTPQTNALALLSKSCKKIMKRVIKQHYGGEYSENGLKIYDTGYNLTNDLKIIGKDWPRLTDNLEKSAKHEKLYAMKLLHFTLSGDINRMADAIALVNFAHSRRMIPIETPVAEKLIDNIYNGLNLINNKVKFLIKYNRDHTGNNVHANAKSTTKRKIKESFLKKIRNLLRHSKKDVFNMAKKKIPKSDIVKTITKKKFSELAKKNMYEQAMLRWQNNLNIVRRKKRDLEEQLKRMKNRMNNIIPKYLRGKINPAIANKRKSRKSLAHKNKKKTNNQKHFNATTRQLKTSPLKTNNRKSVTHADKQNTTKQKILTTPKSIKETEEVE